jgi:hypothetical protein
MPLGSRDLFPQTFFSIPPVVQAGEWIDDSQAVKFVGSHALRYGDLHLFGKSMPKELELAVVVKRITIRDQHQGEQPPHNHGYIQLPRKSVAPQQLWRRKRRQRCQEQD